MPEFIPGLKLSELFYHEAVGPILAMHFPNLQYSAALIGSGSEVLGFDDPILLIIIGDHGCNSSYQRMTMLNTRNT